MPLLTQQVSSFVERVKDDLKYGQVQPRKASASIGSGSVVVTADAPGSAGNEYTIEVTAPTGTSGLSVSESDGAITVALAVNSGTPTTAGNTAALIAAAINSEVDFATARVADGDGSTSITVAETVKSFSGGQDLGVDFNSAPTGAGYLRAQDFASVLELFQDALSQSESLSVASGTAKTVTCAAATFVADSQVGNTVVFDSDTDTAALQGEEAVVIANTATVLTLDRELPASPGASDSFTIRGTMAQPFIDELRGASKGLADAPAGSVYGDSRVVFSALQTLVERLGGSQLADRRVSWSGLATKAGSTEDQVKSAEELRVDQFKGYHLTVDGETRRVVSNTEDTLFLSKDLSSAPSAGTSFTLDFPAVPAGGAFPGRFHFTHPGGHPDSAALAYAIDQAQAEVEGFELPTTA